MSVTSVTTVTKGVVIKVRPDQTLLENDIILNFRVPKAKEGDYVRIKYDQGRPDSIFIGIPKGRERTLMRLMEYGMSYVDATNYYDSIVSPDKFESICTACSTEYGCIDDRYAKVLELWRIHVAERRIYLLGVTEAELEKLTWRYTSDLSKLYKDLLLNPMNYDCISDSTLQSILKATDIPYDQEAYQNSCLLHAIYRGNRNGDALLLWENCKYSLTETNKKYFKSFGVNIDEDGIELLPEKIARVTIERLLSPKGKEFTPVDVIPSSHLDKYQQEAVHNAFRHRVSVITGKAGSGKTTTIKEILRIMKDIEISPHVLLTSFTGKAVMRMQEVCNHPAKTMHLVLTQQATPSIDLIVIDEASMVSSLLLSRFLKCVPKFKRLIFVGDPQQLPPIDNGAMFENMVVSEIFPTTQLHNNHRAESSSLCQIQSGHTRMWTQDKTFSFVSPDDDHLIVKWRKTNYKSKIIICPKNADVDRFNSMCRDPDSENRFDNGEPIVITKNVSALGIVNGYYGHVHSQDDEIITLDFGNDAQRNPNHIKIKKKSRYFKYIKLAWALTVHKSQGSEWDRVFFYSPNIDGNFVDSYMLTTGLTRAKKQLIMGTYQPSLVVEAMKNRKKPRIDLIFMKEIREDAYKYEDDEIAE